jgi:hypothetical protein
MANWSKVGLGFGLCVLLLSACGDDDDAAGGSGGASTSGGTGAMPNTGGASTGGRTTGSGGASAAGATSGGAAGNGAAGNMSIAGGGAGGVVGAISCRGESTEMLDLLNQPCAVEDELCSFGRDCCCGVCHVFHFCRCEEHQWGCWSEDWCRDGCPNTGGGGEQGGGGGGGGAG